MVTEKMTSDHADATPLHVTPEQFAEAVTRALPYTPNDQQSAVLGALGRFLYPLMGGPAPTVSVEPVFILAGYAGTGKTSLTGAIVSVMRHIKVNTVLMAPTGRAAKVFGSMSGQPAYTIHRKIYRHALNTDMSPGLQTNEAHDTLFIVDEASMIGDNEGGQYGSLLTDLIQYVFAGYNNRLIFVGDTAQLPPVGCQHSPAMSIDLLRSMGLKVSRAVLTATARQQQGSGILTNATDLRRHIAANDMVAIPRLMTDGFDDIKIVNPVDLPEEIDAAYRRDGIDGTLLITRSNKRATAFNGAIRDQILYLDGRLQKGEQIMVVKNNYFWSRRVKGLDFIANGDIAVVDHVYGTESRYGFLFADVSLTLPDHDISFDAKVILDTLYSESAAMTGDEIQRLYTAIMTDPQLFSDDTPVEKRLSALRSNPYWNAIQVKYAYAVTCHKAQGGQWNTVFVDMGYIHPDAVGLELYRWLYTAITRARTHLVIIDDRQE